MISDDSYVQAGRWDEPIGNWPTALSVIRGLETEVRWAWLGGKERQAVQ